MKNNIGKKIRDRNLTMSTPSATASKMEANDSAESGDKSEEKQEISGSTSTDDTYSSSSNSKKSDVPNPKVSDKRKESTDKNSFSNLLTFDQVPMKREEKITPRKGTTDRKDSLDDPEKRRKEKEANQSKSKVHTKVVDCVVFIQFDTFNILQDARHDISSITIAQ